MTRTRPTTLLALVVVGLVGAYLLQLLLAATGQAKLRPEYSFALSLAFIAAIVITLAVPVRRATRSEHPRPIDPFYATRVVLLAKASSLTGALLAGAGAGLVLELLSRSGGLDSAALLRTLAMLAAAIVLLVAGLVAEWFCTVPPSDDDPSESDLEPGSVGP